jgi:hypothetical protein
VASFQCHAADSLQKFRQGQQENNLRARFRRGTILRLTFTPFRGGQLAKAVIATD